MSSFWSELKRRSVVKIAVAYTLVAWVVVQVASVFLPTFQAPDWVMPVFSFFVILGFPLALVLAWAFELTPEGVRRDRDDGSARLAPARSGRVLDFIIIAFLSVAVVFFAVDKFWWNDDRGTGVPATAAVTERSIAVLPFDNMSGDESNMPFTNGIHDDLLTHLSKISSLRTISRTSVMQYRGTTKPVAEIARELDVTSILEGGVQRIGDRVRINVQLIDAMSDDYIWAETYDRQLTATNIFAIQTEISMAIAAALQANLSADERQAITSIPTESLEAFELYQMGRQVMARRSTQSVTRAAELFIKATDIDRDFAEAWVELATSYLLMTSLSGLNADEMHKNSRAAVDEALRIAPQLAETQTALANILRNTGDTQGATRAIKNALAANPNYAYARFIYANMLHESGNFQESLAEYERAAKLDPLSPVINDAYAFKLAEVGRFDEALARYKLVDEVEPDYPSAAVSIGTIYGLAYGRLDLANLWYRKALALDPGNPWMASILGLVFLELDDNETAKMWIERSLRQAPGFSWAHGAMAMLQSYTQNNELLREHADAAEQAEIRWRQGTVLSHGRVPDLRAGNYHAALARIEEKYSELFSTEPEISFVNYRVGIDVAGLFILSGDRDRAKVLLDKCEAQISRMIRVGIFGYWISDVQILALRGRADDALTALRQAYDQSWVTDWRYFFYVDPNLDTIRHLPEFQEVFRLIKKDMTEQLKRVHEMEANGEILPVPDEPT